MKGKVKYMIIAIIFICIAIALSFRYKEINKSIPNAYERQAYEVNELVELDDLEFDVESYEIIKGTDKASNDKVSLELEVKNTSSNVIDAEKLIFNSKLSDGFEYLDAPNVSEEDCQGLESLNAGETLKVSIYYSSAPGNINFDNGLKFYIDNESYKNQIVEKYNEGKFYAKYIELK